jgi:hypothetical protein
MRKNELNGYDPAIVLSMALNQTNKRDANVYLSWLCENLYGEKEREEAEYLVKQKIKRLIHSSDIVTRKRVRRIFKIELDS